MGILFKLAGLAATAAGTRVVIKAIKNKKVDVETISKRAVNSVKLTMPIEGTYDNSCPYFHNYDIRVL